jgi:hypothetical protein
MKQRKPKPEPQPGFKPEDLDFSPRNLNPEEMVELKRIAKRFFQFAGALFLASGWLSAVLLRLAINIMLHQSNDELSLPGWVCAGFMALGISWGRIRVWLNLRNDIKGGTALSGRRKGTGAEGKIVWEYLPVSKMNWVYQEKPKEKRASLGA